MAKQTAVQWLVMTYNQRQGYIRFEDIDKAKEMEKEQLMKACDQFSDYPFDIEDHEHYLKETYENYK